MTVVETFKLCSLLILGECSVFVEQREFNSPESFTMMVKFQKILPRSRQIRKKFRDANYNDVSQVSPIQYKCQSERERFIVFTYGVRLSHAFLYV